MSAASPALSSSWSSATPPRGIAPPKKKKSSRDKGKSKSKTAAEPKNEGVDLNWDYAPPAGVALINDRDEDAGEFDWDAVKDDDDVELWLIRVPDSVKPKHLVNLQVDVPSAATSSCIGTLQRKHATFDIWSVGEDDSQPIGGEEIKGLSCLLPRKSKKGKLYPAPKPIAQRLVVAAQAVTPTPPKDDSSTRYQNPPRESYPKDVLKHQFMPYGSLVDVTYTTEDVAMMDVEPTMQDTQPPPSPKKQSKKAADSADPVAGAESEVEVKKAKGKKRKGEAADTAETPAKKPRKTKAT